MLNFFFLQCYNYCYSVLLFVIFQLLGRPYFHYHCFSDSKLANLQSILLASVQSGALLLLQGIHTLCQNHRIILATWLHSLFAALSETLDIKADAGVSTSQVLTLF